VLDLTAITSRVEDLAFSPAGDLAIASERHVWLATASGTVRLSAGNGEDERVECVAFRDARTLAIACRESGLRIVELGGHKPRVTHIATECRWHTMVWSQDGKYIVGGQYEPFVSVIDLEAREELRRLDPGEFDDEGRTAVLFAGATLFTTAYNKLVRWRWADVVSNKAKCRMPKTGVSGHAHLLDLAQLADGTLVALVDAEGDERYLQRFAPTGEQLGAKIEVAATAVRIAAAGDELLVMPYDGDLDVRALDGRPRRALACEVGDKVAIAISADGARVAVGGSHGVSVLPLR
jgi:hypothetical protein